MASPAKDPPKSPSPSGGGLQVDEKKIRFGRSSNKTRVGVKFPIEADAKDDVPKFSIYDKSTDKWEKKSAESVNCSMLVTSATIFNLTENNGIKKAYQYSGQGTKSGAKTWKAIILAAESTIKEEVDTTGKANKSGKPAKYTSINITVPGWVTIFVFANSVYSSLAKEITHSVDGTPKVGEVVKYISPHGRTISTTTLQTLSKAAEPPKPPEDDSK